jgi:hypothetical protein
MVVAVQIVTVSRSGGPGDFCTRPIRLIEDRNLPECFRKSVVGRRPFSLTTGR